MLELQIVDILADDLPNEETNGKDFQVTLYGKNRANESVICHVIGFKPYFYMKIPSHWTHVNVIRMFQDIDGNINSMIATVKKYDPHKDLVNLTKHNLVKCKELYGFKCNPDKTDKLFQFIKLEFTSYSGMSKYSEAIRKKYSELQRQSNNHYDNLYKEWMNLDKDDVCDSHLHESNIHPTIRFIHERNIQPANWIRIALDEDELDQSGLFPKIQYVAEGVHYTEIHPLQEETISPFVIASFDIECDSSHGDFPLPTKDFKKLAIELYDSMNRLYENHTPLERISILLPYCIQAAFDDAVRQKLSSMDASLDISPMYIQNQEQPTPKSVKLCSQAFCEESFLQSMFDPKKRDKTIQTMTTKLNLLRNSDNQFLQVEGDKVIQIGTVFQRYGEDKPYKRHILVIAPEDNLPEEQICDPLPDIEVVCCRDEYELLIQWTHTMKSEDPDYVTGYNIFGFDFGYLYDRALTYCQCSSKYCSRKCMMTKFLNMGKINSPYSFYQRNKRCQLIKKKTSNFGSLDYDRYFHMDGRIIYDLQKEVEKGHNLESYKLDNVAAHFMRGKIKRIESIYVEKPSGAKMFHTKLYTSEFGHLKVGDYISLRLHSNIGETYYKDNRKFKIEHMIPGDKPYLKLKTYMKFHETTENLKRKSLWTPDTSDYFKIEWCLMKDDVSPQDIFKFHKTGGPKGRALVAKYCIQDCELCINLTLALDIIPNNIAMANVCWVPQSYVYLRGQGAKIFSLIAKECDNNNIRIPTVNKPFTGHEYIKLYKTYEGTDSQKRKKMKDHLITERYQERYSEDTPEELNQRIQQDTLNYQYYLDTKDQNPYLQEPWLPYKDYAIEDELDIITTDNPPPRAGYEGAIVLDPDPGIYLEDPVGVVDYASLYPSSIIEKNISHDTLIEDPKYLEYLNDDEYESITYENFIYEEAEGKITISKKRSEVQPYITCNYLKKQEGAPMGIIPTVVQKLLHQRKATKKRLKDETNEFKKKVLDGLQLSYKLVANSVYGQTGARTSPIYKNKLAASTTAIGRARIYDAKWGVQGDEATGTGGWWDSDDPECGGKMLGVVEAPKVIYGDTDSVFIKWSRKRLIDGREVTLTGNKALQYAIDCGKAAGTWVTKHCLHKPQDLEYEKTFYPFILVSKKRYVADKYEFDIDSCKRNSMGIVLKRRDNAPIVKHVFGNVIEKIMIDRDLNKSVEWLQQTLLAIRQGKFPMSYFVITKSLRGYYKNPKSIAHKVLADRIGERDPGNKPKAGDRMPFAYRKLPEDMLVDKDNCYKSGPRKGQPRNRKILQGDRVEDPTYMKENGLDLDYEFYITNQIMNPVKQVLDLEMDPKQTELLFKNI